MRGYQDGNAACVRGPASGTVSCVRTTRDDGLYNQGLRSGTRHPQDVHIVWKRQFCGTRPGDDGAGAQRRGSRLRSSHRQNKNGITTQYNNINAYTIDINEKSEWKIGTKLEIR